MESALKIISGGDPFAIMALIAVLALYLLITHQRNNTKELREAQFAKIKLNADNVNNELDKAKEHIVDLQDIVNKLETDKQLMQKDVEFLKEEHAGIKQDIKEMKSTLNTMALSLERIAAAYNKD